MKEAPWRNPEKPKMQEIVASGKSISRTGNLSAGPRWITAGSMVSAGTSSSTGRKGCIRRRARRLSSSGYPPEKTNECSMRLCSDSNANFWPARIARFKVQIPGCPGIFHSVASYVASGPYI